MTLGQSSHGLQPNSACIDVRCCAPLAQHLTFTKKSNKIATAATVRITLHSPLTELPADTRAPAP
jgi:hypothetical protein